MPLEGQRQSVENIRNRSVLIVFGRGLVGALLPVATITLQIRAVVLRAIGTAQATPVRILILLPVRRIRSTFLVHPGLSAVVAAAHRTHARSRSHPVTALSTTHPRHKSIAALSTPTSALGRLIHHRGSTPATTHRTHALARSHPVTALSTTHSRHKSIATLSTPTSALGRLIHHRGSTPATMHRTHALARSHSVTALAAAHWGHELSRALSTRRLIPSAAPLALHGTRIGAEIAIAAAGTIGILARTKIPLRSTLSARVTGILLASAIAPGGLTQGGDR